MTDAAKPAGLLCPACQVDLVMSDRQGVEIDYCPKCRGVWLDRGELDKIIERSLAYENGPGGQEPRPAPAQDYAQRPVERYPQDYGGGHGRGKHGGGHGGSHGGHGGYGGRRRGFLGSLFDD